MADIYDVDSENAGEISAGFKPIPPGHYLMMMESSERKNFNGQDKLECVFTVVSGGEYENAKIREWFEFWHSDAERSGRWKARWKALCESTIGQPKAPNGDSSALHNKLFIAEVSNEPQWDSKANPPGPHPTNRTNKIVWKKGSIRPPNSDGPAVYGSIGAQAQKSTAPATPAAAAPSTAGATAQAPAVGTGRPPWKR